MFRHQNCLIKVSMIKDVMYNLFTICLNRIEFIYKYISMNSDRNSIDMNTCNPPNRCKPSFISRHKILKPIKSPPPNVRLEINEIPNHLNSPKVTIRKHHNKLPPIYTKEDK